MYMFTQHNKRLDSLKAVLLKIQVFCDVTLCGCGYTGTATSQNAALCKGKFGDL